MKKIMISLFLLCFSGMNAWAQIDLGIETSQDDPKPAKQEKIDEKKDGIFSFMNFSLGNKNQPEKEQIIEPDALTKLTNKAEEGDLDAQITLGYLYLYGGDGVAADQKKSFRYYSMAAAQNDPIALNNLGSLYYSGIGTAKNPEKAVELFQKASTLGNHESSLNLAFIYLTGGGVPKDKNKAMVLFSKAAKEGNPTAQFMLGYAYYKGFVVKADDKRGFDLIKAAADAGYADASYILALLYLDGKGTTKNYGNAVKQLDKAATQGSVEAMMVLAEILARGRIYNQDIFRSHIWYNIASFYGAKEAGNFRDAVESSMKIEEVLSAQSQAERFKEQPSDLTNYIRNTFGYNIKGYMD